MEILHRLGIDYTFFVQLAIILLFFGITRWLFIKDLKKVVEGRVEKTISLAKEAKELQDKANELAETYQVESQRFRQQLRLQVENKRKQVMAEGDEEFKRAQAKLEASHQEEFQERLQELKQHQQTLTRDSEQMVQQLLAKVLR